MKTVVELKNVTKRIRGKKIVDGLSFSVKEGEVFGFLGPNGAGKTTTIRMIVGLIGISSGEITVCGKNAARNFEEAMAHIGAIVENPELYKFLTGYENLQQAARLTKGINTKKVDEVIELVGLKDRIHDKVKTYSLGMRQRLGIAQSLLHDPKVLILDEPTNGLDPAGIREIRDYLRTLAKEQGLAIIVSSHLLSEMEMMCDRFALIQKGKLIDVQNVKTEAEDKQNVYAFHVNNLKHALQLFLAGGYQAKAQEEIIEIIIDKKSVPAVIELLVQAGILIYEVRMITKSLEERFLEMTNDAEVQAHA